MKIFFALLLVLITVLLFGWGGLILGGVAGVLVYEAYKSWAPSNGPPANGNGRTFFK